LNHVPLMFSRRLVVKPDAFHARAAYTRAQSALNAPNASSKPPKDAFRAIHRSATRQPCVRPAGGRVEGFGMRPASRPFQHRRRAQGRSRAAAFWARLVLPLSGPSTTAGHRRRRL
jgi:poly(3-hydroxybutyrate) depolymerase